MLKESEKRAFLMEEYYKCADQITESEDRDPEEFYKSLCLKLSQMAMRQYEQRIINRPQRYIKKQNILEWGLNKQRLYSDCCKGVTDLARREWNIHTQQCTEKLQEQKFIPSRYLQEIKEK